MAPAAAKGAEWRAQGALRAESAAQAEAERSALAWQAPAASIVLSNPQPRR